MEIKKLETGSATKKIKLSKQTTKLKLSGKKVHKTFYLQA
jgi:hypothetical protein